MRLSRLTPILAWYGPGVAYCLYCSATFGASRHALWLHASTLTLLLGLLLLPWIATAHRLGARLSYRISAALLLATVNIALLALYVVDLIFLEKLGAPATLDIFAAYIPQLSATLEVVGLSLPMAALFIAIPWGALVVFWFAFHAHVIALFSATLNLLVRSSAPVTPRRVPVRLIAKSVLWLWIFGNVAIYITLNAKWRTAEPLHSFIFGVPFKGAGANGFFDPDRITDDRAAAARYQPNAAAEKRPLVLILVDALRADQIGVYNSKFNNTPFLNRLHASGQLKLQTTAYSSCTVSLCGILSSLTSRYWHNISAGSQNIADVLSLHGYQNHFLLSGDHTHFYGLRDAFGAHITTFRDGSMVASGDMNDDYLIPSWLAQMKLQSDVGHFFYIHLMGVHQIGARREEFHRWHPFKPPLAAPFVSSIGHPEFVNNYHNGILQTDSVIESIFKHFERLNILQNALIIIAADHGEFLGEFNRVSHGYMPLEPVVRIPLMVYAPRNEAFTDRPLSSQIDIAPTLLSAIKAPLPPQWAGIPLQLETRRDHIVIESPEAAGVVFMHNGARFKYLKTRDGRGEWLFDLSAVDAEHTNLALSAKHTNVIAAARLLNARQ